MVGVGADVHFAVPFDAVTEVQPVIGVVPSKNSTGTSGVMYVGLDVGTPVSARVAVSVIGSPTDVVPFFDATLRVTFGVCLATENVVAAVLPIVSFPPL